MDYKEKLKAIFEKIYFINLSDLARELEMDPSNMRNYAKGKIVTSKEKYDKIVSGIQKFTDAMNEVKTIL